MKSGGLRDISNVMETNGELIEGRKEVQTPLFRKQRKGGAERKSATARKTSFPNSGGVIKKKPSEMADGGQDSQKQPPLKAPLRRCGRYH